MARINPHINFNGNAEEAFTFYKSVFGGEFTNITRFKDIASDEFPVSEKEAKMKTDRRSWSVQKVVKKLRVYSTASL